MSSHSDARLTRILREQMRRECESLRLYEPLPYQEEFHKATNQQVLIQKGNRTGGTLALMVEVARAVTGQDPHGKYPESGGRCVVLGYGEKHIGRVFYDKLFRSGAFRVIRDSITGKWRTFRPWSEAEGGDLEKVAESKPAPPLIPNRFIKGKISWEKRSERVFSLVNFVNGWELYATNSAGDPGQAQGFSVNLYGIDEDLATPGWLQEAIGRVADCGGLIRWSALPHAKNDELMNLINKAEEDAENIRPVAKVIKASIFDNKYLPKQSVEDSASAWRAMGEDIYRKRAMGEISLDSWLMYPTFNKRLHDVMWLGETPTEAQKILANRMGEPPEDWTLYASIDPGYNVCAIIFLAVPPPELGDQIFVYDEAYIKQATDQDFGDMMKIKCHNRRFESFIMDMHGGRLRSVAGGDLPVEKYLAALRSRGVKAEASQSFRHGMDSHTRREGDLRNYLAIQRYGKPRLMIVAPKCRNLEREISGFKKKSIRHGQQDIPTDEGNRRYNVHTVEALEQAIGLNLGWVKKRKLSIETPLDWFTKWGKTMRDRERKSKQFLQGGGSISLGPRGDG